MSMDLVRATIPVVWALVGTLIGLVLYKSSSAFFEQTQKSEGSTRRIRLVGSVVIAALVFLGLRQSTPTPLLTGVPGNSKLVRSAEILGLSEVADQADAAMLSLTGCASISRPDQCRVEMDVVKDRIGQIRARIREISK